MKAGIWHSIPVACIVTVSLMCTGCGRVAKEPEAEGYDIANSAYAWIAYVARSGIWDRIMVFRCWKMV